MFIDLVSAIFQLYCGTKLFFLGEGGPDRYSEVTGEISAIMAGLEIVALYQTFPLIFL
jgi:hypothetical protein